MPGKVQLRPLDVDCDNATRPRDRSAIDRGETNATAADHGNRITDIDTGRVDDGANAGGHSAAEQCRAVERHVAADLHQRVLVNEHLLRESAQIEALMHLAAVQSRKTRLVHGRAIRFTALAVEGLSRGAELTMAAEHAQAANDMVARLHVVHV